MAAIFDWVRSWFRSLIWNWIWSWVQAFGRIARIAWKVLHLPFQVSLWRLLHVAALGSVMGWSLTTWHYARAYNDLTAKLDLTKARQDRLEELCGGKKREMVASMGPQP